MKQNLVDQTCELLKWLRNYRKLHNTTTKEQFWPNNSSDVDKQCSKSVFSKKIALYLKISHWNYPQRLRFPKLSDILSTSDGVGTGDHCEGHVVYWGPFKLNLQLSQDRVAMHSTLLSNTACFLGNLTVCKSVHICQSYDESPSVPFVSDSHCILMQELISKWK